MLILNLHKKNLKNKSKWICWFAYSVTQAYLQKNFVQL